MRVSKQWWYGLFFVAWVAVCYQSLRLEFRGLTTTKSLWRIDVEEKLHRMDGPLYDFLQKAGNLVPGRPDQTIHVYAVDSGYTFVRSNYYLYPRSLQLMDHAHVGPRDLLPGTFVMFYIPPSVLAADPQKVQREFDELADTLPPVVRLYRIPNAGLYRVASRHG